MINSNEVPTIQLLEIMKSLVTIPLTILEWKPEYLAISVGSSKSHEVLANTGNEHWMFMAFASASFFDSDSVLHGR